MDSYSLHVLTSSLVQHGMELAGDAKDIQPYTDDYKKKKKRIKNVEEGKSNTLERSCRTKHGVIANFRIVTDSPSDPTGTRMIEKAVGISAQLGEKVLSPDPRLLALHCEVSLLDGPGLEVDSSLLAQGEMKYSFPSTHYGFPKAPNGRITKRRIAIQCFYRIP